MTSDSSYASSASSDNPKQLPDRDFNYAAADISERAVAKGGVACPFPWRLHEMLKVTEEEGLQDIVCWAPHGRAFAVLKPQEFSDKVMTRFFAQTKFASFQRQLNLYGFSRFCHGRDKGFYYHACFIRGQRSLVRGMIRRKIKGQSAVLRRPLPTEEPDFYSGHATLECMAVDASRDEVPKYVVSPVPPSALTENQVMMAEAPTVPLPPTTHITREVSDGESSPDELDLTLFDGSMFQFISCEDDLVPSLPQPAPAFFDPAAELAKLRAQIRQKKAEYDQFTTIASQRGGSGLEADSLWTEEPHTPRRVSFESRNPTPAPAPSKGIPVYKGSYISV